MNKTKEMVIDFRTRNVTHVPLKINNMDVEVVTEYKYLGTIIDNKFNFASNITAVCKKANTRLFFLRKLYNLKVDKTIMELFYKSVV